MVTLSFSTMTLGESGGAWLGKWVANAEIQEILHNFLKILNKRLDKGGVKCYRIV